MAEFIDRNGRLQRKEYSPSVEGWIKETITFPKERNYGSTWEFPVDVIDELIDNLTKLKETK